jgi:hypothetical protein
VLGGMNEVASIKAKALPLLAERRQAGELATVRADQVKAERVRWVWPGRVPAGKVVVVDGDPGLGKSTVTLDLAARLTTASPLPDGHRPERPMAVLLLSAEDGVADTIRPRLEAAGADLRLVTVVDHVVDEGGPRPVELPADADRIERWCTGYADDPDPAGLRVGLVVVDPLMAFLAGEVNAHRDQDVRRALHPLKLLAERTDVAVLVVRHLNKMTGASALYRGGGSIGIVGAARAGLLVGVDPQDPDRRILAVSKSNLAAKPPSLAYRLIEDELYGTAKVVWEGTSDRTAEDLVGRPVDEDEAPALAEACRVLEEVLADGPLPAGNVKRMAATAGVAERTLQRARHALGVTARRQGWGPGAVYVWSMPANPQQHGEHGEHGADALDTGPAMDATEAMLAMHAGLEDGGEHGRLPFPDDDPGRFTR